MLNPQGTAKLKSELKRLLKLSHDYSSASSSVLCSDRVLRIDFGTMGRAFAEGILEFAHVVPAVSEIGQLLKSIHNCHAAFVALRQPMLTVQNAMVTQGLTMPLEGLLRTISETKSLKSRSESLCEEYNAILNKSLTARADLDPSLLRDVIPMHPRLTLVRSTENCA
jgi:hypothetical protein